MIFEKQSKYLGLIADKALAVYLNTTVSGSSSGDSKSASFAKVIKEPVDQFDMGQISLAVEQNVLSKFQLANAGNTFTVVDLEVGIVRTQGKSVGAQILLGAVDATKNLTLPANPYTTAFGVASTYVNNVLEPLLDQATAESEAVSHHISMSIFAADCRGDDEKTGTKAIIDAVDNFSRPGYVDTDNTNNYCFSAQLVPAFVLKVARLPAGGDCAHVKSTDYVDLRNSYIAFFVNSLSPEFSRTSPATLTKLNKAADVPTPQSELSDRLRKTGWSTGGAADFSKAALSNKHTAAIAKSFHMSARAVDTYRESLKRCEANGIAPNRCFGP